MAVIRMTLEACDANPAAIPMELGEQFGERFEDLRILCQVPFVKSQALSVILDARSEPLGVSCKPRMEVLDSGRRKAGL